VRDAVGRHLGGVGSTGTTGTDAAIAGTAAR